MTDFLRRSVPRQTWEILGAALVLLARAWTRSGRGLFTDWASILAAFWMASVLLEGRKSRPYLAAAVMAGLLVLYGMGEVPQALSTLRGAP